MSRTRKVDRQASAGQRRRFDARVLGSLIAWVVLVFPAGAQEIKVPGIEEFVVPVVRLSMKLSPDGRRIAGLDWDVRTSTVFIADLDDKRVRPLTLWQSAKTRIARGRPKAVHWVSKDLLAVDLDSRESISIDLEGRLVAELGEGFIRAMPEKDPTGHAALVYRDIEDGDLDVVNTRTGERHKYRISLPGKLIKGAFDASGALRAVTLMDSTFWTQKTKISNWYRADEQSPWQLLEEGPVTDDHWLPLYVMSEPDSLAIVSRRERDTYAVLRYDTRKRQVVELMAGHPAQDIRYLRGLEQPNLEVVLTDGIKPEIYWFDGRWAALQGVVDAALPGRINVLQGDKQGRVLVFSYADVDPGRWYLLDSRTSQMREIGQVRPNIDPKSMRPMETIRYAARDGLTVNAYLTRPADSSPTPKPMVVLIHGGPHVRDRWEWDVEVQLLASRGYVVLQPQFRGSSGFGRRFEQAGHRQWGRAMQDDIADGVAHLVRQGIADPERVCIYGASYGGYAAMWGVIKTPELYRCGVSFAGVSDLAAQAAHSFMDDSTVASREIDRQRIGDPERDREWLDEVSPLRHAARVRVPLLIAHGEEDTRVLHSQSKKMVDALRDAGKSIEWITFPRTGHGLYYTRQQIDFYKALLAFLDRHIGSATLSKPSVAEVAAPSR